MTFIQVSYIQVLKHSKNHNKLNCNVHQHCQISHEEPSFQQINLKRNVAKITAHLSV